MIPSLRSRKTQNYDPLIHLLTLHHNQSLLQSLIRCVCVCVQSTSYDDAKCVRFLIIFAHFSPQTLRRRDCCRAHSFNASSFPFRAVTFSALRLQRTACARGVTFLFVGTSSVAALFADFLLLFIFFLFSSCVYRGDHEICIFFSLTHQ